MSRIEWTDETWNPTLGCSRVSAGCDRCYALRASEMRASNPHPAIAAAFADLTSRDPAATLRGDGELDWTGVTRFLEERLTTPFRWRTPRKVFVDSMSDLFQTGRYYSSVGGGIDAPEVIARVWAVMALTPRHIYQVLTKRHGPMRSLLGSERWPGLVRDALVWVTANIDAPMPAERVDAAFRWAEAPEHPDETLTPLPNVWLGVSVEDQAAADLRIPALLATPAAIRFLSSEPLLGPVDLGAAALRPYEREQGGYWEHGPNTPVIADGRNTGKTWVSAPPTQIDWVIVGGETGPGARPMHPDWARGLRNQCTAAGVPFFFKQWGDWAPAPWSVRVCDPHVRWSGTDTELADAKRDSEARGATHALQPHGHLHEATHRPWSIERTSLPDGVAAVRRWGKKAAGRELDGRTWDEQPREPRNPAAPSHGQPQGARDQSGPDPAPAASKTTQDPTATGRRTP